MQEIEALALKFRAAIEEAKEEKQFNRDQRFKNFPSGCCGITSELLAKFLYDNGYRKKITYVSATFYDLDLENPPHAWLVIENDIVLDITGDQFKWYPEPLNFREPVYVGPYNKFYNAFEEQSRKDCGDCKIDNIQYHSFMSLQELYDVICEYV